MRDNLFAHTTAAPNYPAFLSVNRTETGVEITVRAPAKADGGCGDAASITLTPEQFNEFVVSLQRP